MIVSRRCTCIQVNRVTRTTTSRHRKEKLLSKLFWIFNVKFWQKNYITLMANGWSLDHSRRCDESSCCWSLLHSRYCYYYCYCCYYYLYYYDYLAKIPWIHLIQSIGAASVRPRSRTLAHHQALVAGANMAVLALKNSAQPFFKVNYFVNDEKCTFITQFY